MTDPQLPVNPPSATASSRPPAVEAFVLMVDDQAMVGEAVRRLLQDAPGLDFHYVQDSRAALVTIRELRPAVVLLDLVMPVVDGLAVLAAIRADPLIAGTPVVMLSTTDDAATKARAFEAGADDYLVKIPEKVELQARVQYHVRNSLIARERDTAVQALRESQRRLQELNLQLLQLSQSDSLTGLANRRALDETLDVEVRRADRGARALSLLMVDIDHFKRYNDHYGHVQGDDCLKLVSRAIKATAARAGDLVARYGGEEFAVVLPNTDAVAGLQVAEAICAAVRAMAAPHAQSEMGYVSVSVGAAVWLPDSDMSSQALVEAADQALYRAKHAGRDQACN
jgi:two-component system, chemotaxis family, response regulator WspR